MAKMIFRMRRTALSLSQRQVAEAVGVPPITVSRIETGRGPDSPRTRAAEVRVAEFLGVPLSTTEGERKA